MDQSESRQGRAVAIAPDARRGAGAGTFNPLVLRWVASLPAPPSTGPGRRARKFLTRNWYQFLSFMDRRDTMVFMNYGYAPLVEGEASPELRAEDEKDRYCIQLYHRVAGAVDLRGKDVLEVGSGRGGGASYVARYLEPGSMTGMDQAALAVEFSRRTFRHDRLTYARGDAEQMPFPDGSFDVVLNVESSHCYPSMGGFAREAARVLRPGGHLLFADMRHRSMLDPVRADFRAAGLEVWHEEEITANVMRALELDNERKLALIRREVPRIFRPVFRCFAGIKGTPSYDAFVSGEWVYWHFVLRKPPARSPASIDGASLTETEQR